MKYLMISKSKMGVNKHNPCHPSKYESKKGGDLNYIWEYKGLEHFQKLSKWKLKWLVY